MSTNTVPMLSPDGQVGDVPHENVSDAVKSGYKIAQEMISPEGKPGTIPVDSLHDAINAGFHLKHTPLNSGSGTASQAAAFAQSDAGKDLMKLVLKHTGEKLLTGGGVGIGYEAIHKAAKLLGLSQ